MTDCLGDMREKKKKNPTEECDRGLKAKKASTRSAGK